ncbi:amino acid ABC transporter ATP-binding protein [Lichenicoccus sp.]|uniref:amino acid ABC transporter ATP-binding protein n=1 Tax=Lichenicoccus sp. TaxID=2781899 RepID=UPI003D0C9E3D
MTSALIRLDGIRKLYGTTVVLDDITLDVQAGDVVSIIGPSGAGKSTMLRIVNQLETHQAGRLLIEGKIIDPRAGARPLAAMRARIGMVFQGFHLWQHLTALQNVIEGLVQVRKLSSEDARKRGLASLDQVGLQAFADRYPLQLSGGQQQRVAIARALAMEPVAILFDEPTSALDPGLAREVLETMTALASLSVTMLVVTHEMEFARRVSNRIVFMQNGRIGEEAETGAFFANPYTEAARRFISHNHK